jgi:hypothetical protein
MFDFLLTERGQYSYETGKIWFDLTARMHDENHGKSMRTKKLWDAPYLLLTGRGFR